MLYRHVRVLWRMFCCYHVFLDTCLAVAGLFSYRYFANHVALILVDAFFVAKVVMVLAYHGGCMLCHKGRLVSPLVNAWLPIFVEGMVVSSHLSPVRFWGIDIQE
jgi:hypothetical protein